MNSVGKYRTIVRIKVRLQFKDHSILGRGGKGIAVRNPVFIQDSNGNKKFWGFTIAVINVTEIVTDAVSSLGNLGYDYAIYKTEPLNDTYTLVNASNDNIKNGVENVFQAGESEWKLVVAPKNGWEVYKEVVPYMVLGLFILALFTTLVYLTLLLAEDRKMFQDMSGHDALTGLKNQRSFNQCVEHLVVNRLPYGICYIDVNKFKSVNDNYGHKTGDDVLREVSFRLMEATSYNVFRIGGDEFTIIVPEQLSKGGYDELLERIHESFQTPIKTSTVSLDISVSIGYARLPEDTTEPSRLHQIADERMYYQKQKAHKADQ